MCTDGAQIRCQPEMLRTEGAQRECKEGAQRVRRDSAQRGCAKRVRRKGAQKGCMLETNMEWGPRCLFLLLEFYILATSDVVSGWVLI